MNIVTKCGKAAIVIASSRHGFLLAGMLALAASYVSASLGGPAILYALLFGMTFNFLASDEALKSGLDIATGAVLRTGVALLGAAISFDQILDIGPVAFVIIISGTLITLVFGTLLGRALKLETPHAVISAVAVAICGASAALTIASVLPRSQDKDRQTIITVFGVTTLSTLAMVLYPALAYALKFDSHASGILLGATIHDVAQVVGSAYAISDTAGETATVVKLTRVLFLIPVTIGVGFLFPPASANPSQGRRTHLHIPGFIIAFSGLMILNGLGLLPTIFTGILSDISRWCLLVAVAALGVKTALANLFQIGLRPLIAMILQTLLLLFTVATALLYLS